LAIWISSCNKESFKNLKGYWPEAWTCCEQTWETEGCIVGKHHGVLLENRKFLCINVGGKNPRTGRPDSGCGKYFSKENGECKIHSGKN